MQTIITINQINSDQFYKGYLYSEIWNSVAEKIMKNIQNKLSKNLWDNFQSVEHFHKTRRYFTQEKGNIIIETLQNIISNTILKITILILPFINPIYEKVLMTIKDILFLYHTKIMSITN